MGWIFSGLIDGYVDRNGNHPAGDLNALEVFNLHTGTPRLTLAKATIDKSDKVFGLHLDVGVGETMRLVHAMDPAAIDHKGLRYVEQMYLIFKPENTRRTEIDFGQFVSTAGAEVIESSSNWNYTRSFLYTYAVPYFDFGLRSTVPVTKGLTIGFQLINAWNTVWGNNEMDNVAFTVAFSRPKYTYNADYYEGPNHPGAFAGKRNMVDSTVLFKPAAKLKFYVNGDWARDNIGGGAYAQWYGMAAAARYQFAKRFAAAGRAEFFDDEKGAVTGAAHLLKEVTGTLELKLNTHLLARLEARHDASSHPFFDRGQSRPLATTQNTVTLGLVALIGPLK